MPWRARYSEHVVSKRQDLAEIIKGHTAAVMQLAQIMLAIQVQEAIIISWMLE